jgi:hypothetical protein
VPDINCLLVVTLGDTSFTPGIVLINSINASSMSLEVLDTLTHPILEAFDCQDERVMRLAHMLLNRSTTDAVVPCPSAMSIIIAETPIIIPSMLRADRSLFDMIDVRAPAICSVRII